MRLVLSILFLLLASVGFLGAQEVFLADSVWAPAEDEILIPVEDPVAHPLVNEPVLVWQKPLPAVAVTATFAAGISPLFFDMPSRYNKLVREEVQLWRKNSFGFKSCGIDNYIQYFSLGAVHVLDFAGVESRHTSWSLVRRTVGSVFFVTLFAQTMKRSVDEWRPNHISTTSFPSGHTAFAMSGAEMLRLEYGQTSPLIPAAGFVVAAVTGFLRIYNDRHWLGDVMAGAAVGVLSADLSYWLNDKLDDCFAVKRK